MGMRILFRQRISTLKAYLKAKMVPDVGRQAAGPGVRLAAADLGSCVVWASELILGWCPLPGHVSRPVPDTLMRLLVEEIGPGPFFTPALYPGVGCCLQAICQSQ